MVRFPFQYLAALQNEGSLLSHMLSLPSRDPILSTYLMARKVYMAALSISELRGQRP
jgi:hypothetical protein